MTSTRGLFLLVPLLLCGSPALADDLRCGSHIVRKGMTSGEILQKCGEPDLTRKVETPVFVRVEGGGTRQTGVEITLLWYYERGANQYVARVTIREKIAEAIDILDVKKLDALRDEH